MIRIVTVDALLALAVFLILACSVGLAVMRDPLQRLHFIAPPATLASALLCAALFLDEPDATAGFKALAAFVVLSVQNAVVTHATARALRTHRLGHWAPFEEEHIPWVHGGHVRGNPDERTGHGIPPEHPRPGASLGEGAEAGA